MWALMGPVQAGQIPPEEGGAVEERIDGHRLDQLIGRPAGHPGGGELEAGG